MYSWPKYFSLQTVGLENQLENLVLSGKKCRKPVEEIQPADDQPGCGAAAPENFQDFSWKVRFPFLTCQRASDAIPMAWLGTQAECVPLPVVIKLVSDVVHPNTAQNRSEVACVSPIKGCKVIWIVDVLMRKALIDD